MVNFFLCKSKLFQSKLKEAPILLSQNTNEIYFLCGHGFTSDTDVGTIWPPGYSADFSADF